jgi:hypothetical protein
LKAVVPPSITSGSCHPNALTCRCPGNAYVDELSTPRLWGTGEVSASVTEVRACSYHEAHGSHLAGVLAFGFVMIVLCCIGVAFQVPRGPRGDLGR